MRTNLLTQHSAGRVAALARTALISGVFAFCLDLAAQTPGTFTISQSISDQAQRTTLAFAALGMMTGNLEAQSFFPPGKVADYTGFQYLRDNDPDGMGHNTSFLTRVANNVIYVLNDGQLAQLKSLASSQLEAINLYGYKRYPLMKAFRRLMAGETPAGAPSLSLSAVKAASRELYLIDGQISFDRALLYAGIYASMTSAQKAYFDGMKGKGWKSWPDIADSQIRDKMSRLPEGTAVAVMTYASDLFSWYAGSLDADVYFCPERHGTYYGSFYIKDAPAVGHEGYSISEQLTATAGAVLSDSSLGYVTAEQAALIAGLADTQRNNLYAGSPNIVQTRWQIASLLRSLIVSTTGSDAVKSQVLELSGQYGELDGEDNYHYATVFAQAYKSMSAAQKENLTVLRKSIMSGKYADGTPFDYSLCETPFLYSSPIADAGVLIPYTSQTDTFFEAGEPTVQPPSSTADTQPPSPPEIQSAMARSNQVDLKWSAATDNEGVTAYRVYRNGAAVASVSGSTLTFSDKAVAAQSSYTYAVMALDAAGNASPPSNAYGVVTPAVPPAPRPQPRR